MKPPIARPAAYSLRARLLVSAAAFVVLAIVATGLVMNSVLDRFVRGEVASRLDLRIATIASAFEPMPSPGPLPRRRIPPLPPEGPPDQRGRSGWYWQVDSVGQRIAASENLEDRRLPPIDDSDKWPGPPDRLIELEGPDGEALVARVRTWPSRSGDLTIIATAPRGVVRLPLRDAAFTIATTLGLLGLGLLAVIALQVQFTLQPLDRLRHMLSDVRSGRRDRIVGPQPLELRPLTDELNALIAHDAEVLRQARRHVANLGHGLKTPLATLSAQASRLPDGETRREWLSLTELMDRRIRHHLRRARTAAQSGAARQATSLLRHAEDLAAMLQKFQADPAIRIVLAIPGDLAVAVEAEDLDEMLGNLLENACRHTNATVSVFATRSRREVTVTVSDDGSGLEPADIARVLQPGTRLDETSPGHGFGLPITLEIAELYGGSLKLARNSQGGLDAQLTLPRPAETAGDNEPGQERRSSAAAKL